MEQWGQETEFTVHQNEAAPFSGRYSNTKRGTRVLHGGTDRIMDAEMGEELH
jgi:hypothetical protein